MRVVLDTNLLARGIPGRTGPVQVLRSLLHPPHELLVADLLLEELARVLRYPRLRAIHQRSDAEIDDYIVDLQTAAVTVTLRSAPIPQIVLSDPSDDIVLATAVAGQADRIATRDNHLFDPSVQNYCSQFGIRIVDDIELLNELRGTRVP